MTIAIAIKVNDGIVLASDTATIPIIIERNRRFSNSYNNARKIYKVRNDLGIGIASWGCGNMNGFSVKRIVENFGSSTNEGEYKINSENYSVEEVCNLFSKYVYEKFYHSYYDSAPEKCKPEFGCIIAGYDSANDKTRAYEVEISGATVNKSECLEEIIFGGYKEPLLSLVGMFSDVIQKRVINLVQCYTKPELEGPINKLFDVLKKELAQKLSDPGMPLQDAIDLGRFLIDTSIGYHRFSFNQKLIGGHCDIALITKKKNFRWIKKNKLS